MEETYRENRGFAGNILDSFKNQIIRSFAFASGPDFQRFGPGGVDAIQGAYLDALGEVPVYRVCARSAQSLDMLLGAIRASSQMMMAPPRPSVTTLGSVWL